MAIRGASALLFALFLTAASLWVPSRSDERAMYGHEGPLEQNWLSRELAGWPAPYLADNPNTSVPHQIGPAKRLEVEHGAVRFTPDDWMARLFGDDPPEESFPEKAKAILELLEPRL